MRLRNRIKRQIGYMLVTTMLLVMILPGVSGNASEGFDGFVVENGVLVEYAGVENAVQIPADGSVTAIGSYAFLNSSITSVSIPASVTSIGEYAFAGCSSLQSITVPSSVTSVGASAFYGCNSASSLSWESGAAIPDNAFSDCSTLSNVSLFTGVPSIGAEAFRNCESLAAFVVPSGTQSIAANAFDGCINMSAINVEEGNSFFSSYNNVLYTVGGVALIRCPQGSSSVDVFDGTKTISANAFYGCGLGTVELPESVTEVQTNAFTASSIELLRMGSAMQSFGEQAFRSIQRIEIPGAAPVAAALLEQYGSDIVLTNYEPEKPNPPETEEPNPPETEDTEKPNPPETEDTEKPNPPETEDTEKPNPPDTEKPGDGGNTGGDNGNTGGGDNAGDNGNTGGGDNAGDNGNTGGGDNAGDNGNTSGGDNAGDNGNTSGGDNTGDSGNTSGGDNAGDNGNASGNIPAGGGGTTAGNGGNTSGGQTPVEDNTPKTGPGLNARYILCLGVMLLGVYMILTSKKTSYQTV